MFKFLKTVTAGMKAGQKAGQIVLLTQSVIGRPLSSNEQYKVKEFYDSMNYSDEISDSKIVIDYFYFLLGEDEHPCGLSRPKLEMDAKERFINVLHAAIGQGKLRLGESNWTSTPDLLAFKKKTRIYAGLDQ
tara:strand:+ start:75 stop:470 length:396 start_codon:yes stop_codon:yes gene_type:complete